MKPFREPRNPEQVRNEQRNDEAVNVEAVNVEAVNIEPEPRRYNLRRNRRMPERYGIPVENF